MLKRLELKDQDYKELYKFQKNKIYFLCSCFEESLRFLRFTKNRIIKIPSGEITNLPLLKYAGSLKKDNFILRNVHN